MREKMRDFLESHGLWLLLAAAVLSALLAAASLYGGAADVPQNVVNVLSTPFRMAGVAFADWYNDTNDHYRDVTSLKAENEELRRRVAEMEEAIRQAENDSEENRRLRQLLQLREQRRDLSDLETALITEYSVSNWTASLTLDKGTSHGVEEGDCVIDASGALVGVISAAGTNWSRVLTLVDMDTSLGAQVFRTKELGVVQGEFSLMERGLLRLGFLPADCKLLAGDVVVTSGLGGYYPAGLVIGTVEEVLRDDSGSAAYATVTPRVDVHTLTQVAIIKSFDIVA